MAIFHYNNNSKSSGIYIIFNSRNWRVYIGSSKCFQVRWNQHMKALKAKKHSNKFLQADFEKGVLHEGNDDFLFFYILEEMKESSREARLESEEKWISIHFDGGKNCYNLCNRAISREGSASKSETRQKISEAISKLWEDPEYRNKIPVFGSGENNPNYGKSLSEETKSKLREARMKQVFTKEQIEKRAASLRGKPRSEETKRKISIAKKRKQKVAE